jgi:hypothetical protein
VPIGIEHTSQHTKEHTMKSIHDLGVVDRKGLAAALADMAASDYDCMVEVELDDEHWVKAQLTYDYCTSLDDFDCYGRVEHTDWRKVERPKGFDGNAVKIQAQREQYWWQPPLFDKADRRRWAEDPEWRRALTRQTRDVLEYGFSVVSVEYEGFCKCCKQRQGFGAAGLSGLDPVTDQAGVEYFAGTLEDLLAEAGLPEDLGLGGDK